MNTKEKKERDFGDLSLQRGKGNKNLFIYIQYDKVKVINTNLSLDSRLLKPSF